jgi:hypothetical protein
MEIKMLTKKKAIAVSAPVAAVPTLKLKEAAYQAALRDADEAEQKAKAKRDTLKSLADDVQQHRSAALSRARTEYAALTEAHARTTEKIEAEARAGIDAFFRRMAESELDADMIRGPITPSKPTKRRYTKPTHFFHNPDNRQSDGYVMITGSTIRRCTPGKVPHWVVQEMAKAGLTLEHHARQSETESEE